MVIPLTHGGLWIEDEDCCDSVAEWVECPKGSGNFVKGRVFRPRDGVLVFPPHLWHASAPLNVVAYTPRGVDRLPQASVEWLETLGFLVSRAKEVSLGVAGEEVDVFLREVCVETCVEDHVKSCSEDEPKGSAVSALCDGKAGSKDPNISICGPSCCVSGVALLAATLRKCFGMRVLSITLSPHK